MRHNWFECQQALRESIDDFINRESCCPQRLKEKLRHLIRLEQKYKHKESRRKKKGIQ